MAEGKATHPRYIPQVTEGEARRFWSKVQKNGEDQCWVWTAKKFRFGYGQFQFRRGSYIAHRISWVIAHGPIPDGMCVLHNCPDGDNPSCVNPSHLWLGTTQDNIRDCVAKGRSGRGVPKAPEHRSNIAAALKGKAKSPEHRARLSAANIGKKNSAEARAKMSASHRGKRLGEKRSEEQRAKISASLKAYFARKNAANGVESEPGTVGSHNPRL